MTVGAMEAAATKNNEEETSTTTNPSLGLGEGGISAVDDAAYEFRNEFYFDSQLKIWRSSSVMTWAMILFAVFCFGMGFLALLRDDFLYSSILFVSSGIAFLGLIVAVVAGYKTYAKWYFLTPVLTLSFFLILHGGVGQTGLYWCIAFAPGALYLVGPRVGAVVFGLVLSIIIAIFYADLYPWPDRVYSSAQETRFVLALSGIAFFSLGYDHILVKSGLGDPEWRSRI